MAVDTVPIAQKTLFGGEERVSDGLTIAKSAVIDLQSEALRQGLSLSDVKLRACAEWLTLARYPGAREIMRVLVEADGNDARAALRINPKLDAPCFDTISRNLRKAVNGR